MSQPTIRIGDKALVRVRDDDRGAPVQSIGIAACLGPAPFLSVIVHDVEQTEQGRMHLRLGPGPALYLLRRLTEVCRSAFGTADVARELEPRRSSAAPGPRDDTYVPGEPWRRGKWVEPTPKAVRP